MQFSASQQISGFSTYLFAVSHISYYSIGKGTFTWRIFSARLMTVTYWSTVSVDQQAIEIFQACTKMSPCLKCLPVNVLLQGICWMVWNKRTFNQQYGDSVHTFNQQYGDSSNQQYGDTLLLPKGTFTPQWRNSKNLKVISKSYCFRWYPLWYLTVTLLGVVSVASLCFWHCLSITTARITIQRLLLLFLRCISMGSVFNLLYPTILFIGSRLARVV